ncbi:hypothetical protein ACIQOV_01000 [Kitasatospora sp. NPDC091257]|uniref:hypothetical protein n=1 Tax=unclassified Kitasatospora TaxID=2633591 RepID=UPI002F91862E
MLADDVNARIRCRAGGLPLSEIDRTLHAEQHRQDIADRAAEEAAAPAGMPTSQAGTWPAPQLSPSAPPWNAQGLFEGVLELAAGRGGAVGDAEVGGALVEDVGGPGRQGGPAQAPDPFGELWAALLDRSARALRARVKPAGARG